MSEEKEPNQYHFKGVWIPKEIWEATDITWMEKCLVAEIDALSNQTGYCFAGNEYLANKFRSTAASIANQISKLRSLYYLEAVGFDGRTRKLRVTTDLTRWLRQGSLEGLGRVNRLVKSLIEEKKRELKGENTPKAPAGVGDSQGFDFGMDEPKKKQDAAEGFAAFWKEYPKKLSPDSAKRAWVNKQCWRYQEEIMLALALQKDSQSWTKNNGQFIPYPATWLNAGKWKDEIHATPAAKSEMTKF